MALQLRVLLLQLLRQTLQLLMARELQLFGDLSFTNAIRCPISKEAGKKRITILSTFSFLSEVQ